MRVRILQITGVDLKLFDFDHDLTWAAFFMNADGFVYGRFGGRDAKGPDTRNSLLGLRYAMEKALETHRHLAQEKPEPQPQLFIEKVPTARKVVRNGCIHCHQVKEIRRQDEKDNGAWKRASIWVYPLPENIGVTLDHDRGDLVRAVLAGSAAARAGMRAGDVIQKLNGRTVFSFADAQYALHMAPIQGDVDVGWKRGEQAMSATLKLTEGWRKTNLTWRPSMLDLLPSLTVFGYDMTAKEKQVLGIPEKRLAFRQIAPVHAEAQAMGVHEGDVIIGVDDLALNMSVEQFLGYVRQNYLVGDRLTLNVVRDGKKLDLRVKLR